MPGLPVRICTAGTVPHKLPFASRPGPDTFLANVEPRLERR